MSSLPDLRRIAASAWSQTVGIVARALIVRPYSCGFLRPARRCSDIRWAQAVSSWIGEKSTGFRLPAPTGPITPVYPLPRNPGPFPGSEKRAGTYTWRWTLPAWPYALRIAAAASSAS